MKKQLSGLLLNNVSQHRLNREYVIALELIVYNCVKKVEKSKLGGHDNHKVIGHMSKIYAIKYHKDNPKILYWMVIY